MVDAMIWGNSVAASQVVDEAQKLGMWSRVENILEDAKTIYVLRFIRESTQTNVDISLAYSGFEREAIDSAEKLEIPGGSLSVLAVEDLVIMKAVAQRPRDINDIALLAETFPGLNEKRIKHWVQQFGELLDQPELWPQTKRLLDQARRC